MNAKPVTSDWPVIRRLAWYALFIALLGWGSMIDPSPGVSLEPLPLVGHLNA